MILTQTYKALHDLGPAYINHRLRFHQPSRHLRSATLALAHTPCIRRGSRYFSYIAAKTWNNLPLYLRTAPLLSDFRKRLKT